MTLYEYIHLRYSLYLPLSPRSLSRAGNNTSLVFLLDRENSGNYALLRAAKERKCHQIVTTIVKYKVSSHKAGLRYVIIIHFNCRLSAVLFERTAKMNACYKPVVKSSRFFLTITTNYLIIRVNYLCLERAGKSSFFHR